MTLQRHSDLYRPFRLLGGILLLTTLLSSCGNNGCEETRESVLLVQLKPTRGLSLYSLSAWGITAEGDSIPMLSNVSSPTEAEFTLQPDTTFTQIQLHCIVNDTGEYETFDNTLNIRYRHYPYFLDMECGCAIFYDVDSVWVSGALFQQVKLKNAHITNEENVNIILEY